MAVGLGFPCFTPGGERLARVIWSSGTNYPWPVRWKVTLFHPQRARVWRWLLFSLFRPSFYFENNFTVVAERTDVSTTNRGLYSLQFCALYVFLMDKITPSDTSRSLFRHGEENREKVRMSHDVSGGTTASRWQTHWRWFSTGATCAGKERRAKTPEGVGGGWYLFLLLCDLVPWMESKFMLRCWLLIAPPRSDMRAPFELFAVRIYDRTSQRFAAYAKTNLKCLIF